MDNLETLTYCLEAGYPAPVISAFLELVEDNNLLAETYQAWNKWDEFVGVRVSVFDHKYRFLEVVSEIIGEQPSFCVSHNCDAIMWDDDITIVAGEDGVCQSCLDNYYYSCFYCEEWVSETTNVGGSDYCESCLDNYCHYCDHCDAWYNENENHVHDDDCDCESPHTRFKFPNDGHGEVSQNQRFTVELPKGTIDDEGIASIRGLLRREFLYSQPDRSGLLSVMDSVLENVGRAWQAKRGNFTKRLSGILYKEHNYKLTPGVISEIGNIARAHSSEGNTWNIEFTRDLNGSREEFANDDSCWWGSYYKSRCCLKNWGGLGLRSYTEGNSRHYPNGRAWIQPITSDLSPTHDTLGAHAYVIFNGYGDLGGYIAARIVAHLTGRSYRKIHFNTDNMYVNSEVGYLVADQATCDGTEEIYFSNDEHDLCDSHTITREKAAA